jgi:hypothetical protein
LNPRGPRWGDVADLLAWLVLLQETARDLGEAGLDLTRPEIERQLGAVAAREAIVAARAQLYDMIALAIASLAPSDTAGLN